MGDFNARLQEPDNEEETEWMGEHTARDDTQLRRRYVNEAFYSQRRAKNMSKVVYAERMRSAFDRVTGSGTTVPPELQGGTLMTRLDLTEQQEENVLTLTGGSTDIDKIVAVVRRTERSVQEPSPTYFAPILEEEADLVDPEEDEEEDRQVDEGEFLVALEGRDLSEEEIQSVYLDLLKKNNVKKRT